MRPGLTALALVALMVGPAYAAIGGPGFTIDPSQSVAQFSITKLGYADVVGRFTRMEGQLRWVPEAPESSFVRWRVEVSSVKTDAANRDRSIQGPDYFDAARYPYLTFESSQVRAIDPGTLEITGTLTIRGVARQHTVRVRHNRSATAPVFETDFTINRYDFGITGGSVMGRLIGRTVRIHLRAVAVEHTL
jgi:polyisoprenoid-binding protein YceI